MFLMKSRNCDVNKSVEMSKSVVRTFFSYSEELRVVYPGELRIISSSPDIIREVFRHSFCLALNLKSVIAYPEFNEICKLYANVMQARVRGILSKPESYRQGVLQAGVHYMVFSTMKGKKELDENYI